MSYPNAYVYVNQAPDGREQHTDNQNVLESRQVLRIYNYAGAYAT